MDLDQARFNMIEQQIRPWNVLDPNVLKTISLISREEFVPTEYRHLAFADMNIPLGDGQVMMQPKVEARLLQTLAPSKDDLVLEIGTGSGYLTALLAHCCLQVHTVDIRPQFTQLAKWNLANADIINAEFYTGDGGQGWRSELDFNCIVIGGAMITLPQIYRELLCIGGRLVVVLGEFPIMEAKLIERTDISNWGESSLFETVLPPLDNIKEPDRFVF